VAICREIGQAVVHQSAGFREMSMGQAKALVVELEQDLPTRPSRPIRDQARVLRLRQQPHQRWSGLRSKYATFQVCVRVSTARIQRTNRFWKIVYHPEYATAAKSQSTILDSQIELIRNS